MLRSTSWSGFVLLLTLGSCAHKHVDDMPVDDPSATWSLQWTAISEILVDNGQDSWLYDTDKKTFQTVETGLSPDRRWSQSHSKKKILVQNDTQFRWGKDAMHLSDHIDIPLFDSFAAAAKQDAKQSVRSILFWPNDLEILVVEETTQTPDVKRECAIYQTQNNAWKKNAPCPSGQLPGLSDLIPGPKKSLAILSYGEGHPAFDLVEFDTMKGQTTAAAPKIDLYPFGPLNVVFGPDSDQKLWLITPCDLEKTRACEAVDEKTANTRIFEWSITQKKLKSLPVTLAQNNPVISPTSDWVAWISEKNLCVDKLSPVVVSKSCAALPIH